MRKILTYLIFTVVLVLASMTIVAFPGLLAPVAGVVSLDLTETIALFLIAMVILTMLFLALIGLEAGRSIVRFYRS
jgi:hypothetical protein